MDIDKLVNELTYWQPQTSSTRPWPTFKCQKCGKRKSTHHKAIVPRTKLQGVTNWCWWCVMEKIEMWKWPIR